jgi:hypothetical protein
LQDGQLSTSWQPLKPVDTKEGLPKILYWVRDKSLPRMIENNHSQLQLQAKKANLQQSLTVEAFLLSLVVNVAVLVDAVLHPSNHL